MMNLKQLAVDKEMEMAVGSLAKALLTSQAAAQVFIPQYDDSTIAVYATLVSDAERLTRPAPFAPYLSGNMGSEAGQVTLSGPGQMTAVFLRPCEARAFIELSKMKQADRDRTLLITCDCPGTLELEAFKRLRQEYPQAATSIERFYARFHEGQRFEQNPVRACCTYCESLAHPESDVQILLVGVGEQGISIRAGSEAGKAALEKAGIEADDSVDEKIRTFFAERQRHNRLEHDKKWAENIRSVDSFLALLTHCRRCNSCRVACPLCYCRECIFQTSTFELSPDVLTQRAARFGVVKMPTDILLFHLTRMNHMVASCVSCGQCTEACPQGIDVGRMFSAVGKQVQELFSYRAGMDPNQALPLSVFKEHELEPL